MRLGVEHIMSLSQAGQELEPKLMALGLRPRLCQRSALKPRRSTIKNCIFARLAIGNMRNDWSAYSYELK